MIYSTVRFAADMIWCREIAGVLSPHILADLFFGCLWDGEVIPGKSGHASTIGMALASVLSIQLTMEPDNDALGVLCRRVRDVDVSPFPEPMFRLAVAALKYVTAPADADMAHFRGIPDNLSTSRKLWLSRIVLQTLWRWRRVHSAVICPDVMGLICNSPAVDNDRTPTIVKINRFLAMAICLGLKISIHDLHAPNNKCVAPPSFSSC